MARIKIEDIVFFIFIAIIIGTSLWLLYGSPPEIDAMISVGLAVVGSELFLWKYAFNLDKKTELSFIKLKNYMNNRFDIIENKIDSLK